MNKDATPTSNFQPIRLLDLDYCYIFTYLMVNSADPDQMASEEANWSGSTLFAKAGYIRVQQDKVINFELTTEQTTFFLQAALQNKKKINAY